MNLLGKIFIVLILVLSVVFMTLAMAMYATHKNWREEAQKLQTQVQQAQAQLEQKVTEYNRMESELKRVTVDKDQQISKLESERVALEGRNASIQSELDQLKQERREATAAVAATQQNNEKLAGEVTTLRQDIRTNQQLRDQAFASALNATEELHQSKGELDSALERSRQLTSQVAGMTTVMRENGLNPATDPNAVTPRVDGFVSQVKRVAGAQLVEVTIGSDDGLKPGHTVEVFRDSKYLGRVEILKTSPDKSVGRVDRRYQQGQIQEGDRVATQLDLG